MPDMTGVGGRGAVSSRLTGTAGIKHLLGGCAEDVGLRAIELLNEPTHITGV